MKVKGSKCDKCGEFISNLDAGFSPALLGMKHAGCGGTWKPHEREVVEIEDYGGAVVHYPPWMKSAIRHHGQQSSRYLEERS